MAKERGRKAPKSAFRERTAGGEPSEAPEAAPGAAPSAQDPESSDENAPSKGSSQPHQPSIFFGLVDANELDYFKQAESSLNVDAFETPEERDSFTRSVLEEARGKELKLVTNQICSKLMERLVLTATDRQLKAVFRLFQGHFVALSQHKYSSHVVETLLVRAAALVEKELVHKGDGNDDDDEEADDDEDIAVQVPMEDMVASMLVEIRPQMPVLVDHQYASHVLRVVVLVLSGRELPATTASNALRSKKSKIARKMIEIKDSDDFARAFQTPPSFKGQLRELVGSLGVLEVRRARELAAHKVASPLLSLLIQVEGMVDRDRALWHRVFLAEESGTDSQEEAFMEYLLLDPVGSHFLELLIKNDGARLRYIERLHKLYIRERVARLAKRSTTGVFVIQALLAKLKPKEVRPMLDALVPELAELVSVAETQHLELSRAVIDASLRCEDYRREELVEQLAAKFAPGGPETGSFLENTLQLASSTLGNTRGDWPTASERRRALFVEKLVEYDPLFVRCVWYALMELPADRFVQLCNHGVFSHVVEHAMVVKEDALKEDGILRKRVLNLFQGHIVALACNAYGLHVVDRLWTFTILFPVYKDRVAVELYGQSSVVKESNYGKLVWKNWAMEQFSRRKADWKALVKEQEAEFFGGAATGNVEEKGRAKKPIELKMEQLFKEKQAREEQAARAEEGYSKRKGEDSFSKRNAEDFLHGSNKKMKVRGRNR